MTNDSYAAFELIRESVLDEIGCKLFEYEHKKTGARLVYLDRDDENKTFAIAFPTPPTDDSGVFHIIEHSVLCGSEKYPMKDPFAELLKGSLNTFLNAITYEDRTVYPVSSRCEKDFLNLTDVYLDAVFAPKLLTNPAIFSQEGWHYEYDRENESLSINGVVYNEMKGAYSSPDELAAVTLNRMLRPGEIYSFDSGGDPDKIPTLSYEKFKECYERHYHPSGAKIILDGRIDLSKLLPLIDSHLSKFEKREPIAIENIPGGSICENKTIRYEISENEDESGKARLLYGSLCSPLSDKPSQIASLVLSDLLCGSNAAPLKKELIESGLCKDAAMYSAKAGVNQLILEIRDADENRLGEIDAAVERVIRGLCETGIDRAALRAIINNIEFRLRERDFGTLPTGIAFAMTMFGGWMAGELPEESLLTDDAIAYLRERIDLGYFESELMKMTLDNTRRARLVMLPDKKLGEYESKKEKERLDRLLRSMNDDEKDEIIKKEEELRRWQEADEEELLDLLPSLEISDIRAMPPKIKVADRDYNGAKILDCDIKTNAIVYISMNFDASDLKKDELILLSLLSASLTNFPTKNYDPLSLQNEIKANLGNLYSSFAISSRDKKATPYLKVSLSALSQNEEAAVRLIDELLSGSVIENEREMRSLIEQIRANLFEGIVSSGESFAMARVEAKKSEGGLVAEHLQGYEAYRRLCEIAKDEEEISRLTKAVGELLRRLAVRSRLTVAVAGEASADLGERIADLFPEGEKPIKADYSPLPEESEFLIVPSKVSYAAMGGVSEEVGKNLGLMRVIRSILSYEYLWNRIRVKNGAYGAGFVARRDGSLAFYSYRDPSPQGAIDCYREASDYLREIASSDADITKFIIGAIGEYDIVTTPRILFPIAIRDYLCQRDPGEEEATIKAMLAVGREDLLRGADIIDGLLRGATVSVVGAEEHLGAMRDLPKRIIRV